MDSHGDGPESAESDFTTQRLRELDEYLCQPSQSNASADSNDAIPCPDLLEQLEDLSSESNIVQQINPIEIDNRLTTPPLAIEANPPRTVESHSISDLAHEQSPPQSCQQHVEAHEEEQHQLPLRLSVVPSNSQSEQLEESQQTTSTTVKLEHKDSHSPSLSPSPSPPPPPPNQSRRARVIRGFIKENESNQSPRPERSCDICGCPKYCKQARGGILCQTCYKFCTRTIKEPCRNGANCPIVWQPKVKLCSSCKMQRAIRLGFVEPEAEPELIDLQDELDEDIQMQLAIQASLAEEEEQWEDYSCLIDDNTEEEEAKTPRTIEGRRSGETEHPAGGVFIEVTEEEPLPPIDQGLPENVSSQFSRWWWNDLEGFKKGGIAAKRPEEEVKPPKPVRVLRTSNDISDLQLDFVTQDIDVEEPEPIEEIFTPIMQILANASLARGHEPVDPVQPLRAGDAVVAQAKPRLTLRLETHRTIIDRRPMLKRLKTGAAPRNQNESNGVSTTSLIAPGEDCDESDEDEVLEIDCGIT